VRVSIDAHDLALRDHADVDAREAMKNLRARGKIAADNDLA